MPKPKLILNESSSTHSFSEKSNQTVYNIEEWTEFEDSMESFIKDSINKDNSHIYPHKSIEKLDELRSIIEYKSLISWICNAIFSNCLLRKIHFEMKLHVQSFLINSKEYVLKDTCCLNISDSERINPMDCPVCCMVYRKRLGHQRRWKDYRESQDRTDTLPLAA